MAEPTYPTYSFAHDADAAMRADAFGRWDEVREAERVFLTTDLEHRVWYLTRFDDVHAALRDTDTFSSIAVSAIDPTPPENRRRWIPTEIDPPEHGRFRSLLNARLSPGLVADMEPDIRARARELVEGIAPSRGGDFMAQFSKRFPTTIFMGMMGLPVAEADMFLGWVEELLHVSGDDPDFSRRRAATAQVYGYLGELLAERRAAPRGDIVSHLLASEVGGRPLTDDELLNMCFLLYMAGLDTVAGALGYAWQHFADHPAQRRALTAVPGSLPVAMEELLRLYSIVVTGRVVTRDVEVAGCPIRAGDRVVLALPAANRDSAAFDRATDAVLDREANRHLAFGAGPHRCAGNHLARAELRIAFEEWHRVIPDYEVAPGAVLTSHGGGVMGLDALPLVW